MSQHRYVLLPGAVLAMSHRLRGTMLGVRALSVLLNAEQLTPLLCKHGEAQLHAASAEPSIRSSTPAGSFQYIPLPTTPPTLSLTAFCGVCLLWSEFSF